jgi:hypothetical protein
LLESSAVRGKVTLPPEVVWQCLEAMKRFCRMGHFLLSCFLGPTIVDVDLSRSAQVDDDTVALLVSECPRLARLNVSQCLRLTDVSVLSRLKNSLKCLNLRMCHRILSLEMLELPVLEELCVASLRELTRLPVGMRSLLVLDVTECVALEEEAGEWCTVLQVFVARMCPMANDALVMEMAQRCSATLCRVAFAVCELSDLALCTLLKSCPRLWSVTIESVSNECLDHFVAMLQECVLRELCIINCPGIKSLHGLPRVEQLRLDQEIVLESSISQRLSLLRVRGVLFERPVLLSSHLTELWCLDCKVSSDDFNLILRTCKQLQVLDLSQSTQPLLDDSAFAGVSLSQLRDVSLCGCELLTDRGVADLLSGSAEGLLALRLRWCSITDAFFAENSFPALQLLDVSHCRLLTGDSATHWRLQCPAISHLGVAFCSGMALDANLLETCKHLRELNSDGVWVSSSVVASEWRSLSLETLTLMGCELLTGMFVCFFF